MNPNPSTGGSAAKMAALRAALANAERAGTDPAVFGVGGELIAALRAIVSADSEDGTSAPATSEGDLAATQPGGEILIAHVEGGFAAHYSSMTSSSIGAKPVEEGRDEEPIVAFCFECDWTMNSWVFRQYRSCLQSQSITHPAPAPSTPTLRGRSPKGLTGRSRSVY